MKKDRLNRIADAPYNQAVQGVWQTPDWVNALDFDQRAAWMRARTSGGKNFMREHKKVER